MIRHPLAVSLLLVTGALGLTSCGHRSAKQKGSETSPDIVKIAVTKFFADAPLFIAREEGFFDQVGIHAEFIYVNTSNGHTPSLLHGDLDASAGYLTIGDLNAIARGALIRIVADKGHMTHDGCGYISLVVRRSFAATHDLNNPETLIGARVATLDKDFAAYMLDRALELHGLTRKNFRTVPMGGWVTPLAFRQGSIDIGVLAEPYLTPLLHDGTVVRWNSSVQIISGAQWGVIIYGPSLLGRRRNVGIRFMKAYLKGVRQYNEGKTPRNVAILARFTGLTMETVRQICWPSIRSDGQINLQAIMDFERWTMAQGDLTALVPPNRFWSPSFLAAATRTATPPQP